MSNLRIISINFPLSDALVTNEARLTTQRALFDFDVVVIKPYRLHRTAGRAKDDELIARDEMRSKVPELVRVLEQGGLVVVILAELDTVSYTSGSYSSSSTQTTSNYDFVHAGLRHCICNGHGEGVSIVDHAEPFSDVIKNSSVWWTAYINAKAQFPLHPNKVFASNGVDAFVGVSALLANGNVVFLPNFKSLNEAAFLAACSRRVVQKEPTTAPPEWVASLTLPNVVAFDKQIGEIDVAILDLQEKRQRAHEKRQWLLDFRKLLYEKGKTHLEPVVRESLNLLGFGFGENRNITGKGNFEIDGSSPNAGSQATFLEVKGSKNVIPFAEVSTFLTKIHEEFKQTEKMPKGILVGNGLCESLPEGRLGPDVFSKHALHTAAGNHITLVNTVELYWLICNVLLEDNADFSQIKKAILESSGYVDLRPFGGEPKAARAQAEIETNA